MKESKTPLYEREYKEKRSRFLIFGYRVSSMEETNELVKAIRSREKKANHVLYAARFPNHFGVYVTSASEDKEPIASMKKTAQLLERKERKDILVVIVRYFGGVKFGASYLDKVYTSLAMDAVNQMPQ